MIRIACICSNAVSISSHTKKGTEIFINILLSQLAKRKDLAITAFASSDSELPVPVVSLGYPSSMTDVTMPHEKHIIFELALIAKAVHMQDTFDLFHSNIGDGDIVIPFARMIKKPILITLHHIFDLPYSKRYFSLFADLPHVSFVAASNSQKKLLPGLRYAGTIYHGIEEGDFSFASGGDQMLWAGRGIPHKGLDVALAVMKKTKKKLAACVIRKHGHMSWLDDVLSQNNTGTGKQLLSVAYDVKRENLIMEYQGSRVFLFPIRWEEPFGLVVIEAMACGTPVVAFARGAMPEIIEDGETGYLINPSDDDIRGNFIIKQTGVAGFIEAVKRVYTMNEAQYRKMRVSCRKHVEEKFTAKRMADDYRILYKNVIKNHIQ